MSVHYIAFKSSQTVFDDSNRVVCGESDDVAVSPHHVGAVQVEVHTGKGCGTRGVSE